MRLTLRAFVSGLLSFALLAAIPVPASADPVDETLSADSASTFDLPDGGEAVFNPTDPRGVGATVEVEPVETDGATAVTPDGIVVALGDGVDITATSPTGEDIPSLEHEITIIPPEDDQSPATDEMTPAIELTFPVSLEEIEGIDLATLGVYSRESVDDSWVWVPSAYDPDLGAVVAQSDHLSEFTVMGASAAAASGATVPRIALDPDNDVGWGWWNGHREGELEHSYAVSLLVKEMLEETCQAEVLITRDASISSVLPATRANRVRNFNADISMTLAFNAANIQGPGQPWGVYKDGGVVTYAEAGDSADINFTNRFNTIMPSFTTRPNERGPLLSHSLLPYSQFDNASGVHAHVEMLFINHSYDWIVIRDHPDWVADGVYTTIIQQIEATPGIACVEPVTLPEPPTQEEIDEVRQLGYNNYQKYGTDPVNLSTGNYVISEDVFTLSGVGDQEIDLTLAYNALDGRASQVGNGWNFAYSSRVQQYDNGSVMVTLADGRSVFFESNGSGGFVMPAGARSSLVATDTGVRLTFGDNTSLEFTIDEETGYGELTRAIDRQGNAYTLAYGPLAEAEENEIVFPPLLSITDEAGQTVAVTSTPEGRITAFTHPDGRVWTLAYDDAGNLTSITDGADRTSSFSYNAGGLLSVVTGADGVDEITNDYDDESRVVTQTDGAGNVRTIAYGEDRATTLTDALGNASVITHNAKGQATTSRDAEGGLTLTTYDANYNPTESVDANGNIFRSTFDAFGRVLTSTSPLGEVTSFTYNGSGDLTSITMPDSSGGTATTSFVLNSDGRAIETHFPDGTVTYATYDAHGDVTSLTDALGNTTTFLYDARGNTLSVTDALDDTTTSTYDLANRVTSTTDALGNTTTLAWDAADNLTSVTDALGQVTSYEYDANDSLVSQTDPKGLVTTFEYNVNLQVTAVNYPDGTREMLAYDAEHHLVLRTNADGTTRTWEYDALGRATAMVDETGGRWVTEYDAIGNAVATVDPNGNRTATAFDAVRRPTATTDALGNTSSVAFNAAGLVSSSTDELGRSTSFAYDSMGRLLGTTRPDGTTTAFGYDAAGRVTSATDARGFTTAYEYDALGRETAMVDALGGRTTTEYDAAGNLTARTNALGATTEYAHDALSRTVSVTDALGGTLTTGYDPVGNVLASTDALGRVTAFTYDSMSRLASTTLPDGAITGYAYNTMGDLVTVTNPLGATIGYEYDPMGRETARVDEAGERWTTEYDAVGNAIATVDPTGARTTMEYDALGQQVASTDAVAGRTSRTFNAVGVVVGVTDALGQTTGYAYDARDRLTSVTTPQGATTEFGYDANGNATTLRNALGEVLTVEFDALNRPVAQVAPDGGRSVTTYDALGRTIAVTDPNGATKHYGYDALGRLTTRSDGEGFTTSNAYDAVGNLLSVTDSRGGASTSTYDVVNRPVTLTDALGATTTTAYDLAGRVVSTTDPAGIVKRYTYDARGLLTATTENYVADAAPSASVNVTTSTGYDARGLATSVTDPRGNATTYTRDEVGRLTAETDALGRSTSTEYDALGRPTTVTAADGSVSITSYTEDGMVARVVRPDQTVDYTYDAVGNRLTMEDNLGTSSWTYDWAGRSVSETDARGNTTTHAYDLAGNLAGIAYADGRTVERTFDGRGLTVSQTDTTAAGVASVTTFAYDETGAMIGQARASGLEAEIDRDLAGRVTEITYTGLGVTGFTPPWGEVNRSSAVLGNAYGHCKANGNGHPNQQPAGCSTGTLAFAYEYDERGLVAKRDVISDEAITETTYVHDGLGRLTRSVTGGVATFYGWDAASNLVGEGGTDDPSTARTGDVYAIARTVDEANQLVTLVKRPIGMPGGKVATTEFSYDGRGNRTGSVTTTQTGNKTHVESSSTLVYDSMDQLTSTTGSEGSASWVRDGVGRALEVTEDGVMSARLYDGLTVVAQGDTQLTMGPTGQALTESTTTTTTKGKNTTTTVDTVDVLTDVLGSVVATASGGVISADLALFGDFGDLLTTPKQDTITGFTGKIATAGLVEFASRTYDPNTRQWVQDDRYRGATTRSASMNRYAYVEGAPESFVDVLGFFRARAALEAQRLASLDAAFQSAIDELNQFVASQARLTGEWTAAQMMASYNMFHASDDPVVRAAMDQIAREAFYGVWDYKYQQKVQVALAEKAQREATAERNRKLAAIDAMDERAQQKIAAEAGNTLFYDMVTFGQATVSALASVWWDVNRGMAKAEWDTLVAVYDLSTVSLIFTPDRFSGRIADFAAGVEENGLGAQLVITFDPIYHLLAAGDETIQAVESGDWEGVGEGIIHTGVAILETAAVATIGAKPFAPRSSNSTATVPAANTGLATAPNETVFWSGIKGGDQAAASWASKNGGVTLETMMTQRGVTLPAWDASNPAVVSAWRQASAEFAQGARGNVTVLQGDAIRINSVWAEVEYPALTTNPNVTSITAVNPATGSSTVLWTRP